MTTYIQFTKCAILDSLKRVNASKNGNPRYAVRFDGLGIEGITKADSSYCYSICNHWEGKPVYVTYHYTAKGRLVIDNMELVK